MPANISQWAACGFKDGNGRTTESYADNPIKAARRAGERAGVMLMSVEMQGGNLVLTWDARAFEAPGTSEQLHTFTWELAGYEDPKAIEQWVYDEVMSHPYRWES